MSDFGHSTGGGPPSSGGFGGAGFGSPPGGGGFGGDSGDSSPGSVPGAGSSFGGPAEDRHRRDVITRLTAPAIVLMLGHGLGILLSLFFLAATFFAPDLGSESVGPARNFQASPLLHALGISVQVLPLLVGALCIFGLVRMLHGRSWGLAVAAVSLGAIPIVSPCCVIGLPVGIWALTVLMQDEVHQSFR